MATVVNFIDTTLQAAATRTVNLPTAQVLLPPSAIFHVTTGGVGSPTSLTFTPTLIDLAGTISFSCIGGTLTNVTATSADLTYANMSASTATVTAAVTVNGSTYTTLCTVSKVLDGATGTNTCRVYAYQRSASAPTGTPGDVTVTFASNSITYPAALANGWVFDIPTTNGNPLYVTAISGAGSGATVNLLSAGWSGAAVMATDGPGGTGTNGTNGLNSATITIYQRSATATALSLPSASTTYTFATGVLAGLNNGWSTAYPAVDSSKPFVQMSLATAISAAATDAIAASEWNAAQLQYDATAVINAQASADAANNALTNIASDNILSPSEKPEAVKDYSVITNEQAGIDSLASSFGITTEKTDYDTAVAALTTYLGTLSGWNTIPGGDVTIVGTTFRSKFSDVYAKRQVLLNAIAAKTAYAPSAIIGGRNLYPDSGFERGTHPCTGGSAINSFGFTSGLVAPYAGTKYLAFDTNGGNAYLSLGGPKCPVRPGVVYRYSFMYATNGSTITASNVYLIDSAGGFWPVALPALNTSGNWTLCEFQWTAPAGVTTAEARFGIVCSAYSWMAVDCIQLEEGNKRTQWMPAPEDVAADTAAAQSAADAAANTANTVNTTINSPPVISTISNVTATNVYKPAVTIATKTPSVSAGVGPFTFDWRAENITVGDVDITYTVSTVTNTNDKNTIKAISQVTGGLPSQDLVTVTATDAKGRVSITQFTVNASC